MSKGLDTDLLRQITHAITIEENEDTWELKEKTMLQLQSVTLQHPSPPTALLLTLLRNMHFIEGFTASIKSLRTQLATTSCQTLSVLIKMLREDFEPFGEYFMATLLKTCAQTKRIVANAAGQTIKELIFNAPSPKYLQLLYNVILDRNSLLRSRGAEFFRDLVPKINFKSPYKSTTVELIENCLRKMLGDANSIVREFGCEVLDMYQLLWPGKVGEFIESLDYSTRKQLLKKDERMAAAFPTFSSITYSSSQMKESSLMHEEPNDLFCSSSSIQSPRKSLYEDFLENETRRVESKILMEKSIEFLKQNQVELKVFHILGLKELEEIALTETPKFLPVQMFYDESKGADPINSLKNIIVKSKDDSVWNMDEFESALNRIFEYSATFSRENSLYAFFVLLSNQGTYYMSQISVEMWKRLMNLLSEKGTAELDEIKSIEDEIILLLGINVSFENVCKYHAPLAVD